MMASTVRGTRESFVEGLIAAAESSPAVSLVSADSIKALRAVPFRERFPDRFYELGIAEQTAVTFAAGLAAAGQVPFVGTYAGFLTMRAAEQMRTFVAYPKLTVKFAGLNGGIYGGEREGVTHQFFEDVGILRTIAGYEVIVPCDGPQTRLATIETAKRPGPGYIRVGSGTEPLIVGDGEAFEFGKARVLETHGRDVALFTCGPVLRVVLDAAARLKSDGIRATVVEIHTVKPIDSEAVAQVLGQVPAAVTIEDHNIIGGLGSAITEVSTETTPRIILRMGIRDTYPVSGDREELWEHYGFTADEIARTARLAIEKAGR